jgi:hypothetical protein
VKKLGTLRQSKQGLGAGLVGATAWHMVVVAAPAAIKSSAATAAAFGV